MIRIGIDLGGTNIAVGAVDDGHAIVSRVSVPTLARRPAAEVVGDMGDAVEAALAKAGLSIGDCRSIGIGSPGTCNSAAGVVERAYNLGWDHVPVCRMLEERFHVPCRLSNDANCAALAEQVAGAAVGHDNVVLITLGTGVGGGIIIGGKIYDGMRGAGAELGHTLLVLDGEPCTCGRRGCWEAYSSATALIRQARQAAAEHPESLLAGAEEITGKTVFDAADRGDETANAVVDRFCDYLGAGVTNIVNALAPEVILIGCLASTETLAAIPVRAAATGGHSHLAGVFGLLPAADHQGAENAHADWKGRRGQKSNRTGHALAAGRQHEYHQHPEGGEQPVQPCGFGKQAPDGGRRYGHECPAQDQLYQIHRHI